MHEKGHEQKPVVKPEFIHARTELEFKTIGQRPFFYVFSFCSNILPGLNFTLRRGNIGARIPAFPFGLFPKVEAPESLEYDAVTFVQLFSYYCLQRFQMLATLLLRNRKTGGYFIYQICFIHISNSPWFKESPVKQVHQAFISL